MNERNPGVSETPFIDVTAIYSLPRTTGIQRVVRDIVGDGNGVRLVRYSSKLGQYIHVPSLPSLIPRAETSLGRKLRQLAKSVSFRVWVFFGHVAEKTGATRIYGPDRRKSSRIYALLLSDAVLSTTKEATGIQLPVTLTSGDWLWLLDIPKSSEHVEFIKRTIESSECRFGIYIYDIIPVDHPELIGGAASEEVRREYLEYLSLVPLASRVFFLSQYTRARYLAFAARSGIKPPKSESVVYPPLSLRRYDDLVQHEVRKNPELRDFLGDSKGRMRAFCVSPLNRRKNLKVALEAFEILANRGSNLQFLVVAPTLSAGDQETVTLVHRLAKKYPNDFLVLNQVSDAELVACYQAADIVMMPSILEGFGLPIVEGLYFGCHVLASNESSFIELGQLLPIDLLPSSDPRAWAEKIQEKNGIRPAAFDVSAFLPSPDQFRELMVSQ